MHQRARQSHHAFAPLKVTQPLRIDLSAKGARCALDRIADALDGAERFLLLLTPHSARARQRLPQGNDSCDVPRNSRHPPDGRDRRTAPLDLARTQWLDFRESANYDNSFAQLLKRSSTIAWTARDDRRDSSASCNQSTTTSPRDTSRTSPAGSGSCARSSSGSPRAAGASVDHRRGGQGKTALAVLRSERRPEVAGAHHFRAQS